MGCIYRRVGSDTQGHSSDTGIALSDNCHPLAEALCQALYNLLHNETNFPKVSYSVHKGVKVLS